MSAPMNHDDRLQGYRGRFQEKIGDLDLSAWLFVHPDIPRVCMDGLPTGPHDYLVDNRLVQFPGTMIPGVYMRAGISGKHSILRFDERGNIEELDEWNETDFLVKSDTGTYVALRDLFGECSRDASRPISNGIALRQRPEFGLSISLERYPTHMIGSHTSLQPSVRQALTTLAHAIVHTSHDGYLLTDGMLQYLAREVRDQHTQREQRRHSS